jgi:hypothetical protein
MRTHTCIILSSVVLISFLSCPAANAQEEQWLQYRSAAEARQIVGDMTYQFKEPSSAKPEGVKLPSLTAETPYFVLWETPMAKSGKVWMVFDKSNKNGSYDRLYLDANVNGDLSDETALSPSRRESNTAYFGPVKVVFEGEDGPITYHLELQLYASPDRAYCLIAPAGWYEGPITVGGVKKHCVLIDYNVNGTFNDKSDNPGNCDRIRIGPQDSRDSRFVGNYIEVDDKLYRTEIARDGAFIVLKDAADVPYGTVRLADNITSLSAGGENGQFIRKPEKGALKLPVGTYRIDYWSIAKDDGKGSKWELQGRNLPGSSGTFTVAQDKEAQLSVGEPVYSMVSYNQSGGSFTFSQRLQGHQNEQITLLRNGSRPQPPRLRIRNKDGTYDRGMSFEYG